MPRAINVVARQQMSNRPAMQIVDDDDNKTSRELNLVIWNQSKTYKPVIKPNLIVIISRLSGKRRSDHRPVCEWIILDETFY